MTTTPPTHEGDLMELVRSADPLEDPIDPVADEAAESLLREILAAPRPERSPRTRPSTKVVVRLAAVGAAAAVAVAAITAVTGGDRGAVAPASAAVVRHALAAAVQPPGTILHVDMRGTQNNGDGTTITWRDQSWQENGAPYDRRHVETKPDGTTVESGNVGDSELVYDSATNTIYASGSTASQASRPNGAQLQTRHNYRISPGPTPNTYTVRLMVFRITPGHGYKIVPGRGRQYRLVITGSQAKTLKDGSDIIRWVRAPRGAGTLNGYRPAVVPAPAAATAPDCSDFGSQDYGDQILTMLRSCGAHLVGHATIGGRDTLELRSQDGHITYYVDASSYAPVQLDTTGTDGGTSLRFTTYEVLPADDANEAMLSLTAQHPSATVDQSQADYLAAEKRLFPNG
jgi:hypothetical protein